MPGPPSTLQNSTIQPRASENLGRPLAHSDQEMLTYCPGEIAPCYPGGVLAEHWRSCLLTFARMLFPLNRFNGVDFAAERFQGLAGCCYCCVSFVCK